VDALLAKGIAMLLITFKTTKLIDLIKTLRHMTGWGLYESKLAAEQGMLFNSAAQLGSFLMRLQLYNPEVVVEVQKYKRVPAPQDATGLFVH
jgi:hypothetical protein